MQAKDARPPWEAVLAIALVSFCILAAEVALTRIFSVLFRAPYVFLIVSGAIGGLGFGGLIVQAVRPGEERLRDWIIGLSVVLAAALAAPVLLLFASPWGRELVSQAETAVVVGLPMTTFCVAGMLLSLIFRRYSRSGGYLYFVDLAAAALAAPAAVLLLGWLGGINTPLLLAALAAAAGVALAVRSRRWAWAAPAAVCLAAFLGVLGTNLARGWISLPPLKTPPAAQNDPLHPWHALTKPLFQELADPFNPPAVVRTDWTAVSRTDVTREDDRYYIYTDGDVPTQMDPWDGRLESARTEYGRFIGMLPYRLGRRNPEQVMAIGSGGGLDVLLALAAGAKKVDAVEINPSIPAIVADPRFAHTYARVYREPGVRLVVDEGRSFLQRAGKYDVIYFACAKTATTQTGGVALLDNHLYTVEAFRDYWRHLSDEGLLALVVQEQFAIDRLLITALSALRSEGVPAADAGSHLLTARVPLEMFQYGPYRHILLMRRRAWSAGEMAAVSRVVRQNALQPLYLPHVKPHGAEGAPFDPSAPIARIQAVLERQYPIPEDPFRPGSPKTLAYLAPVTDDSPFYADIARGLHPTLAQLLWGALAATVAVLVLVLGLGLRVVGREARIGPGADPNEGADTQAGKPALLLAAVLYFAMLGMGFMFVELGLMQRFILLLGFPTRSLTVTLCALLVSSALGSRVSQRGSAPDAAARLRKALPVLVLLLVLYCFALPPLLSTLLPLPLWARAAATALLLFPAGFLMGMPFPTVLRGLEGAYRRLIPAFWSVNGVTSILGSVATMALAKFYGYTGALLAGAACYLVAWGAVQILTERSR
jgi:protein-L-isoaspartate O-methyltransferase